MKIKTEIAGVIYEQEENLFYIDDQYCVGSITCGPYATASEAHMAIKTYDNELANKYATGVCI